MARDLIAASGLGYLIGNAPSTVHNSVTADKVGSADVKSAESAVVAALGARILGAVAELTTSDAEQPARLFQVVDKTHLDLDVVLPTVNVLQERGLVQTVERDPHGNNAIALTAKGEQAAKGDGSALTT